MFSNRTDKETSLRGTINRSEHLGLLLRLMQQRYSWKKGVQTGIASNINDYVLDYFMDEYNQSKLFS